MTQKELDLLELDLSTRTPYWVKAKYEDSVITIIAVNPYGEAYPDMANYTLPTDEVKPFLRPLSSMTSDEKMTLAGICLKYAPSSDVEGMVSELLKFYCYRYLDYNHLIEKGLALEAPEGMYDELMKEKSL